MQSEIWKTLYTGDFDTDKFLYHYTTFETALKIIDTDSILFSMLNKTNDPSEAKVKIIFSPEDVATQSDYDKYVKNITNYFHKYNSFVQLLCFSMDTKLNQTDINNIVSKLLPKEKYYDISGRGFALPRMWAQYGDNNKGVCLVINKKKLMELVKKYIVIFKHGPVVYKHFYDSWFIDKEMMESLYNKTTLMSNGGFALLKLLEQDDVFLKYNYFEKNWDWNNENEFRIITLVNESTIKQRVPIYNILSAIEGIVLGEYVDVTNEKIMKLILADQNKKCELKRITFDDRLYKLI